MNKKELLKYLDICAAAIFINAFVFTFLFQFSSQGICLFVALWSYLIASVIYVVMGAFRIALSVKDNADELEFDLTDKRKAFIVVNMILSTLIFIAALIILIAL